MNSIDIDEYETSLPPSLNSHPFIQTARYIKSPLQLLHECQKLFGNIFTLKFVGMSDFVMVCSPEDLKTLFTGNPDVLYAGEANHSVFGTFVGPGSTFMRDGDDHKTHKQFMLPIFSSDRMEIFVEDIIGLTNAHINSWTKGNAFPMQTETRKIALDIILNVVFGLGRSAEKHPLAVLLTKLVNVGFTSPLVMMPALQQDWGRYSPWGKILRLVRDTDEAIYTEIRRRKSGGIDESRRDVLSLLLHVEKDEGPLSDREIRDELIGMLAGGHEAVGTPLAWMFERILSQPRIYEKVKKELDEVLDGNKLTWIHLKQLNYLDAVIKETFRTRSVMPNGGSRLVKTPFEIGGYTIPAGVIISNCMYLLHCNDEIYPEPGRFQPERFLNKKIDPYTWTPFGGGIRHCLGMAFALMEMRAIIAATLSKTQLRILNPNAKIIRNGFFLGPEGGPSVALERRIS